jgi:hypothetical protein
MVQNDSCPEFCEIYEVERLSTHGTVEKRAQKYHVKATSTTDLTNGLRVPLLVCRLVKTGTMMNTGRLLLSIEGLTVNWPHFES